MNCPLFFLLVFLNLTNRELEYFDECSSKKIENMSLYNLQLIQLTKLKKKRRNRQGKKIAISMTNCQKISAKEKQSKYKTEDARAGVSIVTNDNQLLN